MTAVGIYLFDDIELLDFAGPYEVFSVASDLLGPGRCRVFSVSEDGHARRSVNGLAMTPDHSFADHPPIGVLAVPGGNGTRFEMKKKSVLEWVAKNHRSAELTFSVCSGARILGAAGLLDGLRAATHHDVIPELREIAPAAHIDEDARFIDEGRVLTSAGISAGIDLSLHIVERLFGAEIRLRTAEYMEYGDWRTR